MCSETVSRIAPDLRNQIEVLLETGKFGVCSGDVRICDVKSGSLTTAKQPSGDRFKVIVPYGGQTLTWEVIFDQTYPEDPPDFIFGIEDTDDFCPDIEDVKSILEWDHRNPRALLLVIEELLQLYRQYQERLIEVSSRLQFEYSSLLDQTELKPDDIEIYAFRQSESKLGAVHFLVRLSADFNRIPHYLTRDNPGDDTAVLLLTFNSPDGSRVLPQLYLSPKVEHALGGAANLRIPAFPSGGCLIDYVPNVCQLLKNKVDQVVNNYEKRKEYVAAFLSYFNSSLLEYDADQFTKISFLFEWNDFFFILSIELPQFFPKEQPTLTFQSIYHECRGKPYTETYNDYPYSPRWSGNEMAERTKSFILEAISSFQKTSVVSGSL